MLAMILTLQWSISQQSLAKAALEMSKGRGEELAFHRLCFHSSSKVSSIIMLSREESGRPWLHHAKQA